MICQIIPSNDFLNKSDFANRVRTHPPDPLDTIKKDLRKLFGMLGLALALPTVLLSGPFAGYLISQWLIKKHGWTPETTLAFMLLGLAGSVIQTVRILRLLYNEGNEKKGL